MLISFFAGLLDLRDGSFTYANAGHCHPCVISAGKVTELPVAGSAIGFSRSVLHSEQRMDARQGDTVVLYTDGLSEVGSGVQVPAVLQKVLPGQDYHRRILDAALEAGKTLLLDKETFIKEADASQLTVTGVQIPG